MESLKLIQRKQSSSKLVKDDTSFERPLCLSNFQRKVTLKWIKITDQKKFSRFDLTKSLFKLKVSDMNRKSNYLKNLIFNSFEKCAKNDIADANFKSNKELLINELKKESITPENHGRKLHMFNKEKNYNMISSLLKSLPGFKAFLLFNKIDDISLMDTSMHIKYKFYKKGEQLFKEGDTSDCFYGIIRGKVELKIHMIHYINTGYITPLFSKCAVKMKFFEGALPNKLMEVYEQRILILGEGQCFGELGLTYNTDRTASAYAFEDLDVFVVDKSTFQISFAKNIYVSDHYRKQYISDIFPFMKKLDKKVIDAIYKLMIIRFYKLNELIYLEGSPTKHVFLIYQGECVLTNLKNKTDFSDIVKVNELSSEKLIYLSKGAVTGFEIVNKFTSKSTSKRYFKEEINKAEFTHNFTCYSTSDTTVIYLIELEKFPNYLKDFIKLLKDIGKTHLELVNTIKESGSAFRDKYKINYKAKLTQTEMLNTINREQSSTSTEFKIRKITEPKRCRNKRNDSLSIFNLLSTDSINVLESARDDDSAINKVSISNRKDSYKNLSYRYGMFKDFNTFSETSININPQLLMENDKQIIQYSTEGQITKENDTMFKQQNCNLIANIGEYNKAVVTSHSKSSFKLSRRLAKISSDVSITETKSCSKKLTNPRFFKSDMSELKKLSKFGFKAIKYFSNGAESYSSGRFSLPLLNHLSKDKSS